jgi:hypothetical protein
MIRAEHGLPTLRILLARGAGPDGLTTEQAVLEAVVGGGVPREIFRCDTGELGLPDRAEATQVPDQDFRLPGALAAAVAAAVAEMDTTGAGRGALWLELPAPHGDLHLVPWERLLAAVVRDRPVLRLPYHCLRARAGGGSYQVAVACTVSRAALPPEVDLARVVADHVRGWVRSSGGTARVHVFARDETAPRIRELTADLAGVVVHDPAAAQDLPASGLGRGVSPADLSTNPWLLWMTAALAGQALDALHVLTYGDLSRTGGRLLLARSPVSGGERDACLLVGSTPLSGALAQLGAWGVVLSGLPGDPSPAGLRDLADAIAQLRPGAVAAHAVAAAGTADFDMAIARVFGDGPAVPPVPTLTCWVQPELVDYTSEQADSLLLTPTGQSAVIAPTTGDVLAGLDTPAWVAAGARFLEAQQADWLGSTPTDRADDAAVTALRSVSELLDAHVRKHLRGSGEGEGPT